MKLNNMKDPNKDLQRTKYHMLEFNKKNINNMGRGEALVIGGLITFYRWS